MLGVRPALVRENPQEGYVPDGEEGESVGR